ncbi:MAG TPA: bifunctional serine/threonine-protein kinase/formylglycine-generating enzyme family protein [Planctomycetota bacterium]|nr:bifunctional serine/threonine-protein kinase/formylglycine-generating enzyme family protein [Planctomycetota bacterium]
MQQPASHALNELVAAALAALEDGGAPALAAFLAAHEADRAAIEARITTLQDLGLAPQVPTSVVAPRQLGPYSVVRRLGEGGFGEVFLARQDQPIQRQVAIKLLRPSADSLHLLHRFAAERELLARFDHPFIAKVLDAGVAPDGRPWLAVEYVEGVPLTEFGARLDLEAGLRLFVKVCDGVQHAHQRGVIHRDLKPSNVLVTEVDGEPWPKIIDFGVARLVDADGSDGRTRAGTVLGTPEYMSPEQASGARDIDTRADVYALGAMLFELVAGDLPHGRARWRAASFSEQLDLIRTGAAEKPSARAADPRLARRLRGDLDQVVAMALAKERDRRYRTVAELADDVERHLRGEPVLAAPPSLRYLAGKFVRRHRLAIVAAAAVAAALLAALGLALGAAAKARAELGRFLGLADVVALRELRAEAEALWPAWPERVADYERWLAQADALRAGAERRGALRAELAARRRTGPELLPAERLLDEMLARLEDDLRAFESPVEDMRRRLAFAREVEQRTLRDTAQAWAEASAAVAASPRYGGLALRPRLGLVPLGADPDSGLQEFAVLQTGEPPARDDAGRLVLDEQSAMVLVLLPGSAFWMGAQDEDPGRANYQPTLSAGDGAALPAGAPALTAAARLAWPGDVQQVELAPFFIGKHEMTRAQWRRAFDTDPSVYPIGESTPDGALTGRHPVENLAFDEARTAMQRLGLALPTEAQWEYACRAGTSTRWHTGDAPASLQDHANIAGAESVLLAQQGMKTTAAVRDRHLFPAPVGTYRPNAFGLHDVHGNLAEWCADPLLPFSFPVRGGDGLRGDPALQAQTRCLRGGTYGDVAERCASSHRGSGLVGARNALAGVRAAAPLR